MPQSIQWIQAKSVITKKEALSHGLIGIDQNGKIAEVITALQGKTRNISPISTFSEGILAPAMVDIHVHGLMGHDAMSDHQINHFQNHFPKYGVGSFLLATVTDSEEKTINMLSSFTGDESSFSEHPSGAELLGFYLEGPFLCPAKCGAHPESKILKPDVNLLKKFLNASSIKKNGSRETQSKILVMAPEVSGVEDCTKLARDQNVALSMGHSGASYKEAAEAFKDGFKQVTHLYNAMNPLHHREPSLVGFALDEKCLLAELICDGIHIHPAVVRLTIKTKGEDSIIMITDGISASGMGDGHYKLGSIDVIVDSSIARTKTGAIAGSLLTMDVGLKNLCNWMNYSLEDFPNLFKMASLNPAKAAGAAHRKGSIDAGKDADLILLDDQLNLKKTWCKGKLAYESD